MADVLGLQEDDEPETPADRKQSALSYSLCRNSRTSQILCIRP